MLKKQYNLRERSVFDVNGYFHHTPIALLPQWGWQDLHFLWQDLHYFIHIYTFIMFTYICFLSYSQSKPSQPHVSIPWARVVYFGHEW